VISIFFQSGIHTCLEEAEPNVIFEYQEDSKNLLIVVNKIDKHRFHKIEQIKF
jgi:hypothetical protein